MANLRDPYDVYLDPSLQTGFEGIVNPAEYFDRSQPPEAPRPAPSDNPWHTLQAPGYDQPTALAPAVVNGGYPAGYNPNTDPRQGYTPVKGDWDWVDPRTNPDRIPNPRIDIPTTIPTPPAPPKPPTQLTLPGGSGNSGGGGNNGGGGGTPAPATNGINYSGLGNPGVFRGPVQQVGQDPFSTLLTNKIADLINSNGAFGESDSGKTLNDQLQTTLQGLMSRRGQVEPGVRAAEFESARGEADRARRTAMNQVRAQLAARQIGSLPGLPSGEEGNAIGRIEERIAPVFSDLVNKYMGRREQAENERLMGATQQAGNLANLNNARAQERFQNVLGAVNAGTGRQGLLSQIALQNLGQNMSWNQFLAQLGLDRSKVMNDLQNGQISNIAPLIAMFNQLSNTAAGGYV